ncbi:hypothetical protein JRQ81_008126 [Phrynocephalus forsythii]|uniref:Uncharacterized protein n=1 Tax=Phrynocephalus forsythii TaxID=171643 RepID=A0A9Q0XDD0_9SAUR|nr:hypothetical protein JRQ81_008126 [Phrynocephalus forsythii]
MKTHLLTLFACTGCCWIFLLRGMGQHWADSAEGHPALRMTGSDVGRQRPELAGSPEGKERCWCLPRAIRPGTISPTEPDPIIQNWGSFPPLGRAPVFLKTHPGPGGAVQGEAANWRSCVLISTDAPLGSSNRMAWMPLDPLRPSGRRPGRVAPPAGQALELMAPLPLGWTIHTICEKDTALLDAGSGPP